MPAPSPASKPTGLALVPSSSTDAAEAHRIREKASFLPTLWTAICEERPCLQVAGIARGRDRVESPYYGARVFANTKSYDVDLEHKVRRPWSPTIKPTTEELREVLQGVKYYNTCTVACYVLYDLIIALFKNDPYIKDVKWVWTFPRARFFIFPTKTHAIKLPNGHEAHYGHDFILLYSISNTQYVIDLTGQQFGLRGWFHTWTEYKMNCAIQLLNAPEYMVRNRGEEFKKTHKSPEEWEDLFLKAFATDLYSLVQSKLAAKDRDFTDQEANINDFLVKTFRKGMLAAMRYKEMAGSDQKGCFPSVYKEWASKSTFFPDTERRWEHYTGKTG